MENFLIDIGNSNCKSVFHKDGELYDLVKSSEKELTEHLISLLKGREVNIIVLSTVRENNPEMEKILSENCNKLIVLNDKTKLPINLKYNFPDHTLGADRRAGALAVAMMFPEKNCIKFDFGTALTIDFINCDSVYYNGHISLGMQSRFRALSEFTKRLPMIDTSLGIPEFTKTTEGAMVAGVVLGLKFEVEGYINNNPDNIIVFTGGDADYFAEKIESNIFVVKNLVLMGLAQIADYYA